MSDHEKRYELYKGLTMVFSKPLYNGGRNFVKYNSITKKYATGNTASTMYNSSAPVWIDGVTSKVVKDIARQLENIGYTRHTTDWQGKGKKDRIVPFPISFKEILALHTQSVMQKGGKYLFESSWKKPYTDRGIRKILAVYAKEAGMKHSISPHKFRHFLFTWLKKQGIEDALIQPYSGHESRQSLEIYSKLSIGDAQSVYENVIGKFPV